MKHVCTRFSIINQVAILMLLLGALGIAGLSIAGGIAQSIQGNAYAINSSGSLRMQSYRLLAGVPLGQEQQGYITELQRTLQSPALQVAVRDAKEEARYERLQRYWQRTLLPTLQNAATPQQAEKQVAGFVTQLDALVSALDQQTERRLGQIDLAQKVFSALTLALLAITVWYLRHRLLHPWRQLVTLSQAIGGGDFSRRFEPGNAQDEMATLGAALNAMSHELSQMYGRLEQLVAEKTDDLQQKNRVLSYLYRTSRQLHSDGPLCTRLLPVLNELQALTPLSALQVRLYENNNDERFDDFHTGLAQRPADCPRPACRICLTPADAAPGTIVSWSLNDQAGRYGLLLGNLPADISLLPEQRQLIETLAEQITAMLALEQQAEQKQQLVVMEERSAIARELHDSIAQSLSCLKMQVSYLQMQSVELPPPTRALLQEMREELNAAYRQLRELLTTFRLRLEEPGLLPALQVTVDEFNQRLGFNIDFDYRLPPRSVSPHLAIHLLQIAREALSNVLKHAAASRVSLSVQPVDGGYQMVIRDNGCGIDDNPQQRNHYGLIIMADRARSLGGKCSIARWNEGGTEVCVHVPLTSAFAPDLKESSL